MKRITIINQDSGYLMIDIANSYFNKGYDTTLIAGRIVERDIPLNKGIIVKKIKRYDRTSNVRRLMSWFIGTFQILMLVYFRYRNSHLLIVSNPPLAPLLPLLVKNPFSLLIFDVFPDALTEYGFAAEDSFIVRLWSKANRKVYRKASKIYTLTAGMSKAIKKYVSSQKIEIVPLWTSNNFLKPVPKKDNPFIRKHNLEDKFVVLYSGNFGYAHRVDLIIDLAAKIDDSRIMFVIIGGGPNKSKLEQRIIAENIDNCMILPWQDVEMLPYSLSSADLSLVTLSENAVNLAIPSKVFNYMSVGSPVLGITGQGSDLENLIMNYQIGRSFRPEQFDEIIDFIKELSVTPQLCEFYRENSLRSSKLHTVDNVELITRYDL